MSKAERLLRAAAAALAFAFLLTFAEPAAAAQWREASSAHFVIYSEQNARSIQEFATKLERFDKAMRYLRSFPDEPVGNANRVTVYVLSDENLVQKLYGSGARQNGGAVMGFYVPRAGGSVAFVPRPGGGNGSIFDLNGQTVLLHEYAHHFMLQNFPGAYPAWFIEGFAEFYSTASFEKDGSVGVGRIAMHRAPQLLMDKPLPVEKLVAISRAKIGSDEGRAIYGRGWLLVHYLLMGNGRKGQLADYLTRMNRGATSLDAARAAFGDLKQLDRELSRYMERALYYLPIPADKLPIGPVSVRELSQPENAVMALRIRSARGVDLESAKSLVAVMRTAAAAYPKDPAVQNVLAEGEFDAGNAREAEAAADRALAADPKSIHALLYKARAEMALARAAGNRSDARWHEIRRIIATANRLDPDDPRPLIFFYRSYVAQGVRPTPNAAMGLTTALVLAPQDTELRMNVAHQYLVDGKAAEARMTLGPVAYDPHGGAASEMASRTLALLDSQGAAAALAAWNKAAAESGDEQRRKKSDD